LLVLASSSIASFLPKASAATINPTYAGTKDNGDELEINFSEHNNTVVYLANQNWINFSIGLGRYTFDYMSLGTFIYSVSYKASWLNEPVVSYNWSYHDPANLKDDDPNSKSYVQGTVSLNDAPLGNQQITVTALAGCYATDFHTYWIYTADTSLTLNFTVANQPPKTPSPTFSYESGILWRTNIEWNLTGTPVQDLWAAELDRKERKWTEPIVVNGVLYAGATSSVYLNQYGHPSRSWINVYALDPNDGKQIWDYQATAFNSITNLAVANGKVYFGAETGWDNSSLNALNILDGNLIWSTPCDIFYSTPVTENGKVFINSGHSMLALDGGNGKLLWNYTTDKVIVSSPAVANGIVYVSSYDNTLYALNALDGSKIWSIKNDKGLSGFTVVNDVVYAASGDGKIYAFKAATGNKLWSQNVAPAEFQWVNSTHCSTPIYYSGALYFTGWSEESLEDARVGIRGVCFSHFKSYVYALNIGNHNKIWNFTSDSFGFDNFAAVSEGVVFTATNQRLIGFNAQNGALIWNYTNGDLWPNENPTITKGSLYVGFSDGQLYAIRAPSLGTQTGNQNITLNNVDQNISLLITIVAVLALALATLLLLYRKRHSRQQQEQLQKKQST
jgi:outer membrane protein assembly factor BamB